MGVFTNNGRVPGIAGVTYIFVGMTNAQVITHETAATDQLTILVGLTNREQVGAGKTGVTVADA